MEEQQATRKDDDVGQLATEKLFHSKKVKHPGLASQRQYYESKSSWNKFIGVDFASRRPPGVTVGQAPPVELSKSHPRPGGTQTSAVARLYELKMQRLSMQRNLSVREEAQNDVASVSNMSTGTFSRPPSILSDASTKILDGPLEKSAWKPFRPSKGLVGKKAKGVGLLHVDGRDETDFTPLRDTYGEQKQEPVSDSGGEKSSFSCTEAKELRSRMKSEMYLFPRMEVLQDAKSAAFPFSKRLSALERTQAFSRLHALEKEANTRIVDVDDAEMKAMISYPLRSASCRLRPEVMERFERIRQLSEHADRLYMVESRT